MMKDKIAGDEAISPITEDKRLTRRATRILLAGVFLASFSLLALEVTLTRLLSVILLYHFVFAVVSLALLGLGAGGIFVHFFRRRVPGGNHRFTVLARYASLISVSIPLTVILMIRLGRIEAVQDNILLYGLLLFIPFFLTGLLLAEVFRMFPASSARIYGADMVGAALGALGVILLLDVLGGINTGFLLGIVAAVAGLVFVSPAFRENLRGLILPATSLIIVSGLLVVNLIGPYLPAIPVTGANPAKEISLALSTPAAPGKIIETRWSAFGRTDLVAFDNRPEQMKIFIDGTAGTPMYRFNGDFNNPDTAIEGLKNNFTGYFPFFFLTEAERNNALIIGPGGGRDVLLALMGGVEEITAVEVNKDLIDIVRQHTEYNGGIYSDFTNVTVIADEGRNFLKRQNEKYDIILLTLPVTQTSRSLEGYSLTENFLFTTDSIGDYLEHLTDEGRLVVVNHDDITMWKLLSTSLAALNERGVSDTEAMKQIYMMGLSSPGILPLYVLKKTPFETAEATVRQEKMVQLGYNPMLSYFPYIEAPDMVNHLLRDMSQGRIIFRDIEENMARTMELDISPASDNRPFFYKIETGVPQPVSLVFWPSVIIMALVIVTPPLIWKRRPSGKETQAKGKRPPNRFPVRSTVLFSMLGIGFMLVEISLIQRFVLFLGQPILSLAVLLFSLLAGAGAGSLYSGRLTSKKIPGGIAAAALAITATVVAYTFIIPPLFNQLLGLPLAIRLAAMIIVLIPLGFLMGFPFPLGIRALKEANLENFIPWMWGINGVGSVLGSVLTIVIAVVFGFTQALLIGAVCYLVVFLTFKGLGTRPG